MLLKKILM